MFAFRRNPLPRLGGVPRSSRGGLWRVTAAVATVILWQLPLGNYLLYPFTILATWFHEMGHGLTAILLGGYFHELVIFPNGSGFASYGGEVLLGRLGHGLVAMGGPLGPAIAGSILILSSQSPRATSICLQTLGMMIMVSTLLWVRSLFGIVFMLLMGLGILLIAYRGSRWLKDFSIQFLGVQACISTFHQLGYLFTHSTPSGHLSDTGLLQEYLFLPYWLWGAIISFLAVAILAWSLKKTYHSSV